MGGSKTRFGFAGGSEPPDNDEPQSARTVFGHDIHLQLPPDFTPPRPPGVPTPVPPAAARWSVAAPVPTPVSEQESTSPVPARRPTRPRQSRLARFLGRWTRSGRFVSRSRMDLEADDDLALPRDTTGRNVLLVLLVAGLTFGVTFAVVKLRQRLAAPIPQPQAQAVAPPTAPPVPAPPAPAALPVVPPAPAGPVTVAQPASPPPPPATKGPGGGAPAPKPHKRTARPLAEPPAHLKNQLLPFAP